MLLTQTAQIDYEERCKLDVLGLADYPDGGVIKQHLDLWRPKSPEIVREIKKSHDVDGRQAT